MNMQAVHNEIGAMIRANRIKKNMTQLELSKALGYDSMQFVSLMERGLSKAPANVIGKLIIVLDIPEKKITGMLKKNFEVKLNAEIAAGVEDATTQLN